MSKYRITLQNKIRADNSIYEVTLIIIAPNESSAEHIARLRFPDYDYDVTVEAYELAS